MNLLSQIKNTLSFNVHNSKTEKKILLAKAKISFHSFRGLPDDLLLVSLESLTIFTSLSSVILPMRSFH
jgi:hypothetical protein